MQRLFAGRQSVNKHQGYFNHCEALFQEWSIARPSRLPCLPRSPLPPWVNISQFVSTDFPVRPKGTNPLHVLEYFQDLKDENYKNYQEIFTDGSKTKVHVASAYVIPDMSLEFYVSLPREASVLMADLKAIDKALEYCVEHAEQLELWI